MASLNHLPIEILRNILLSLTSRDLIRASRVSRTLQAVAESLIYKSFCLSPNRLCRLIDTLLTPWRAVIGTYVFELTLGSNHFQFFLDSVGHEERGSLDNDSERVQDERGEADSRDERRARNCGSPDGMNTCLANIQCIPLLHQQTSPANPPRDNERLTAAASRFGLDAEFTLTPFLLLLHLLPNLMSLTITFPPGEFRFMEELQSIPVSKLPVGLRSLRHFTSRQQGVSPSILCTLLQLPLISTINVHIFEAPNKDPDENSFPVDNLWWTADEFLSVASGTSTVTTLKLDCNSLCADALSHILSIPRALQILSYESDPPFRVSLALSHALIPHQNSLRELTLECDVESNIGSLHHWPKLYSVTCSLKTLLGGPASSVGLEDILPRGIKMLDILYDDKWSKREAVDLVLRLLSRKKAMMPRLKTIGVRRDDEKEVKDWNRLELACLEAGVELLDDYETLEWL